MAKGKARSGTNKWKRERQDRRHQNLIDCLAGKKGRCLLGSVDQEKARMLPSSVLGTITCPLCGATKVLVANKHGEKSSYLEDYLIPHAKHKSTHVCGASNIKLNLLSVVS